jgi:hypothetical protein
LLYSAALFAGCQGFGGALAGGAGRRRETSAPRRETEIEACVAEKNAESVDGLPAF